MVKSEKYTENDLQEILNDLVFDFYLLFDEIQNNGLIPTSSKILLLNYYLKIIKKEYGDINAKI